MSKHGTNEPSGLEVEGSTAGASGADDHGPPNGFQLDLLCAIVRLEQIKDLLDEGREDFAFWLLTARVIDCDVPRLRGYLTAKTLAWAKEIG